METKTGCWDRAPGGEDYFQIGWWQRAKRACESRSERAESENPLNEALLHNNRNICMLYCSLPFSTLNLSASISGQMGRDKIGMKSDCHGPRLGPGPSVSRGRWSERSVVTIWKCCRDQSCLASSRSGSLFREKERAVNPHHFNTQLSFYNKPFDVQKYFCWCR